MTSLDELGHKLALMKSERSFRRTVRRLSVQDLRMRLLQEVNRLNNAINNIGIVYDQSKTPEVKAPVIAEAESQIAYISNVLDYLFEKLESL